MNAHTAVTVAEPRRSVLITMATKYSMEPAAFEQTLRATVFPEKGSREQFAAFLVVANEYGLNPLTKEIYAFPTRGGGVQPIVSVDGWCNLINSNPQLDGIEFDDHIDGDAVTAITARIWRKDRTKPIVVTEYLAECVRQTDTWKQYPRRMLRHKALIQCARYAFGFSGIVDPDEAERMGADVSAMRDVTPARVDRPRPPNPNAAPIEPEIVESEDPAPQQQQAAPSRPRPPNPNAPAPKPAEPAPSIDTARDLKGEIMDTIKSFTTKEDCFAFAQSINLKIAPLAAHEKKEVMMAYVTRQQELVGAE